MSCDFRRPFPLPYARTNTDTGAHAHSPLRRGRCPGHRNDLRSTAHVSVGREPSTLPTNQIVECRTHRTYRAGSGLRRQYRRLEVRPKVYVPRHFTPRRGRADERADAPSAVVVRRYRHAGRHAVPHGLRADGGSRARKQEQGANRPRSACRRAARHGASNCSAAAVTIRTRGPKLVMLASVALWCAITCDADTNALPSLV